MARKVISIDLDFLEKNVAPLFEVKQLDDITLSINMYMDGVEYDATGQTGLLSIKSTKRTGKQDTDIVLDNSKATIKVNNGMIQDQGVCYGELTLTDANGTMSSTDFVFLVSNRISEGGLNPGQIQSYYEQFKQLLADSTNKMNKALDDMAIEKDALFEEFSTGLTNLINNTQSQIASQIGRVDAQIDAMLDATETNNTKVDTKLSKLQTDYDTTKLTFTNTINGKVEEIGNKLIEADSKLIELESDIDNAIKRSDDNVLENTNAINQLITDIEADVAAQVAAQVDAQVLRIDTAIGAGTVDLETKDARTDMNGVAHANLRARLESDAKKVKEIYENVEGSYITVNDTVQGAVTDIEILGNTWQDPNNLSNIVSAGIVQEDGKVKLSILSCGKVIIDGSMFTELGEFTNGEPSPTNFKKRCINYINIHPNKVYRNNQTNKSCQFVWYDKDKQFLSATLAFNSATSPSNARYLRIALAVDSDFTQTMVYQGDSQLTSYEPYRFDKSDILLPCQLEGLESGRDRLYYDKEEKAWCIDKNIVDEYLSTYTGWSSPQVAGAYIKTSISISDKTSIRSLMCNKLKVLATGEWSLNSAKGVYLSDSLNLGVLIPRDELSNLNISGVLKWFEDNDVVVKIVSKLTQKIILPLDIQIALNSFANQTNAWIESGAVDAIFKGKVPKSLASSLQSAHTEIEKLDTRVKNIEGLQESQNFKYATSKGSIVCEQTRNGVIDKMKISGKTLVNRFIWERNGVDNANVKEIICKDYQNINSGKVSIPNISDKHISTGLYNRRTSAFIRTQYIQPFSTSVIDLDVEEAYLYNIIGDVVNGWSSCEELKKHAMFVPGDYPNLHEQIGYFEGLASVGDGVDKLEVLTRKEDGNLFDYNKLTKNLSGATFVINDDSVSLDTKGLTYSYLRYQFKGEPNKSYNFYNEYENASAPTWIKGAKDYYCANGQSLKFVTKSDGIADITFYGSITTPITVIPVFSKIRIWKGDSSIPPANNYREHKKQILYYDPTDQTWKKPILRGTDTIQDTIEQHSDGKSKYTRRFKTIQLLSTMNWGNGVDNADAKLTQSFNVSVPGAKQYGEILGNSFNKNSAYSDDVGINCEATNSIYVRVLKSDLATVDIDGWKVKLKAWEDAGTPLEIVYEVAEEVYECTPLNLDSYANETMISFSGGAINPHMEFEITSYVNNLILNNRDRLSNLEKFIYEQNLAMLTIGLNVLNNNLQGGK